VGSVSLLKVALALLLFAGGLAAALVALDVRAWRDELTAADARYEAGAQ
jgi:hypothetical protein